MNNKLIYFVSAYVWNPKYEDKELVDSGYDVEILYKTENKLKAENYFNQLTVTDNMPQIMLELDDGNCIDRLRMKDSTGLYTEY